MGHFSAPRNLGLRAGGSLKWVTCESLVVTVERANFCGYKRRVHCGLVLLMFLVVFVPQLWVLAHFFVWRCCPGEAQCNLSEVGTSKS